MGWLRDQRPDLVERYERLYRRGAYAPQEERKRLSRLVHRHGHSHRFVQVRPDPADAFEAQPAPETQQALF